MPKKQKQPKSNLTRAREGFESAQRGVEQGQLDMLDLPSLFEAAAKQANPNYGLSRADILAKYDAPEYSDPTSDRFIDPSSRLAYADRLQRGYQGVLGDATTRAAALLGRDLTSRQFSLDRASDAYGRASELEADERGFERQVALERLRAGLRASGDASASGAFSRDIEAARNAIASGADPTAVSSRLFSAYPREDQTTIRNSLRGAGYSRAPQDVGYNYFGPGNTPVSAEDYSAALGIGLDEALAGSTNPNDQRRIRDIVGSRSKIDPLTLSLIGRSR